MALCCLRPLFCYSFGCAEKTDGVIFEVNIMDAIGNTPLFELKNIFAGRNNVSVFAKAEFLNPSGSVKDRACIRYDWSAAWISRTALSALQREHRAEEDHPGIWRRNYRDRSLRGGGRRFFLARELAEKNPDQYFYPDQYNDDANWRAHYTHTAEEIWKQTEGRITHFVAEAGTSGTFVGNTRRLRELKPEVQCILMQPDSPFHGIEGVKHMASTLPRGFLIRIWRTARWRSVRGEPMRW